MSGPSTAALAGPTESSPAPPAVPSKTGCGGKPDALWLGLCERVCEAVELCVGETEGLCVWLCVSDGDALGLRVWLCVGVGEQTFLSASSQMPR